MFELIILVVVIMAIYNKTKRDKEGGRWIGNSSMPNTTVTSAELGKPTRSADTAGSGIGRGGDQYYGQAAGAWKAMKGAWTGQPQQRTQNRSAGKSTQEAIREAKEAGHSTTAYLMEKAEADAREHEREKYEEQKRLYETRGGLAVAERYLEGDSFPQGKKCVNCGYCGAQNLVPMMPHTRYSCYFCREPLT